MLEEHLLGAKSASIKEPITPFLVSRFISASHQPQRRGHDQESARFVKSNGQAGISGGQGVHGSSGREGPHPCSLEALREAVEMWACRVNNETIEFAGANYTKATRDGKSRLSMNPQIREEPKKWCDREAARDHA